MGNTSGNTENYRILAPEQGHRLPLIIHVPHGSREIPEDLQLDLMLTRQQLETELSAMTDHYTEKLARPARDLGATLFVNRVSRLVVDPERFADDQRETAADHGMGAVYTRAHDGRPLRYPDFDSEQRRLLMDRLYFPYHKAFTDLVADFLDEFGHVFIIDLHSYPRQPLPFEDPDRPRPEVCLGFEDTHRPEDWVEWWESRIVGPTGQTRVATNTPFAGSFVPGRYYRRDPRVKSLMVELRRDTYLDEDSGQLRQPGWVGQTLTSFFQFVCQDVADIINPPVEGLSRREARRIAQSHVQQQSPGSRTGVLKVLNPADFKAFNLKPPTPHGVDPAALLRSWIAIYRHPDDTLGNSPRIVMVDRLTGKILYCGSAQGEAGA